MNVEYRVICRALRQRSNLRNTLDIECKSCTTCHECQPAKMLTSLGCWYAVVLMIRPLTLRIDP